MRLDSTFYNKLVDLYAGQELPQELETELVEASATDPTLMKDMDTLRQVVSRLHTEKAVEYGEDTQYRIMMKLQAWSGEDLLNSEEQIPSWQYRLPMEG